MHDYHAPILTSFTLHKVSFLSDLTVPVFRSIIGKVFSSPGLQFATRTAELSDRVAYDSTRNPLPYTGIENTNPSTNPSHS